MSLYCFWILLDGTIVIPDSRHILAVVAAPSAFGLTEDFINRTFKDFGQSPLSNFEGQARELILSCVIISNIIRIRKLQHKKDQHWSCQLYQLTDERRTSLSRWARFVTHHFNDRFSDVRIHQLSDNSRIITSINLLGEEYSSDGDEALTILTQSQLMELYNK